MITRRAIARCAGRLLLCSVGRHHWRSPSMDHGADIPAEFSPLPGEDTAAVVAKFRSYVNVRCTRCRKLHPTSRV